MGGVLHTLTSCRGPPRRVTLSTTKVRMASLNLLSALSDRTRGLRPSPIPGPKGAPLVGAMPDFARSPLDFLMEVQRTYGDVVRIPIGPQELFVISHPDTIEQVLLKDAGRYHKDEVTQMLSVTLGQGLLTAEGDHWRHNRKLIAPAFRKGQLDRYGEAMVRAANDGLARIHDGQIVDVHHLNMHITLQIVAETLFGADVSADAEAIGHSIEAMMQHFVAQVRSWRRLVPLWVPLPGRIAIRREFKRIDAVLYRIIADRRAGGTDGDDVLSALLRARDEDGGALDDAQLRDEAITLFVAGHETTALLLTYAQWLLAQNPVEDARLRAELEDVLGDRAPTPADLPNLPFTEAVLKEAMRVLPPVWAIGRSPQTEVVLEGYLIPPGAQLILSQWLVHHDPRWYDDPMAFRPDRWLDGSLAALPRFAYFPFGGGPRVCVGNHFAMLEATLVLAVLHRAVRFEARSSRLPELLPSVTLRPTHAVALRARRLGRHAR